MAARGRHLPVRVEGRARGSREAGALPPLREQRPRPIPASCSSASASSTAPPTGTRSASCSMVDAASRRRPHERAVTSAVRACGCRRWVDVCALDDIVPTDRRRARWSAGGRSRVVRAGDRRRVYALSQLRPVQRGVRARRAASSATRAARPRSPRPSSSRASICEPAHASTIPAVRLPVYPVRVRDGRVEVRDAAREHRDSQLVCRARLDAGPRRHRGRAQPPLERAARASSRR